jgi:arginyl-tRNA synthetase
VPVPPEPKEAVRLMSQFSSEKIMESIIADLDHFGVRFDSYYRESTLYSDGAVDQTLNEFREEGFAYEKDGAIWFTMSLLEGNEDRVLVKSDGEKTYFASDIAYHHNKFNRGFDLLIDIWGSDHHGYIPRMKAAVEALGRHKDSLKVLLIQFVTLLKEGKPVGMSTRAGQFTTLKEVLDEVGTDAARFFFLMRKSDAHLEFDLDLAKKTSNENPVYYVQYAHARMASIFRNAIDVGIDLNSLGEADLDLLTMKEEMSLIKKMLHFTDVLEGGARSLEPHRITFYLLDLVGGFHSYYNKARVLGEDQHLSLARLALLKVLQTAIQSGLETLGVSAPERM